MLSLKLQEFQLKNIHSDYIKGNSFIYNGKTLATIKQADEQVVFSIHPQLEMKEYEVLRDLILQTTAGKDVELDESECQLGYLENGEPAYLIKNWESWKEFLMKAKLRTLEGQNVLIKNEEEEELGNGLLTDYTTESTPFRITSVTLITIFGEQKYDGDNLILEPTNLFQ
jgi:hypothetical protein